MATKQLLVLPKKCRIKVMEMAHSIPLAGHLGKTRTTNRVLQRFYWPTIICIRREIAECLHTCGSCQKTSSRGACWALFVPLHIIQHPFQRIAMEYIVGPLWRSRQVNRFVLVICDYATRYLEAVPMKSVDESIFESWSPIRNLRHQFHLKAVYWVAQVATCPTNTIPPSNRWISWVI